MTPLDYVGLPVWVAVRPNAKNFTVTQGKGANSRAAEVSALMEAIELWSAEQLPPQSRTSVRGGAALVPRQLVSDRQASARRFPCAAGVDLLSGRPVCVPEALAVADFAATPRRGFAGFHANMNGLAAGNTRDEALLHALCEAIERDALSLWHQKPEHVRERTRVNLASVHDLQVRRMLAMVRDAGAAVHVWDIASDTAVPAFHCVIDDLHGRAPFMGMCTGAGCHPSAAIALCRAIGEAVQSRAALIVGVRDNVAPANYGGIGDQVNLASLLFAPRDDVPGGRFQDHLSYATDSVAEDLRLTLERVRAAGISQVAAIDLTQPEIGIPVWRVLTPELEGMHHKPGYKSGPRARRLLARYRRAQGT